MTESVNWANLMEQSGGDFETLPKGSYDVIVDTAEATRSSTDKTMFKIKFKVQGGPHNGRTIFNNITLTIDNPNALRMFFLNMKALGLNADFFSNNPTPDQVAAALLGAPATVVLDHRMYQGAMRENVKSLLPRAGITAGGQMAPVGPSISVPTTSPSVPSSPAPAAPVVSQPAPAAPPAPPVAAPAPAPAPQQAAAPKEESTVPIPPPANPAPADDTPALPSGMTAEQYEQFKAFQAAQAAPAAAPAGPPAMPGSQAF